MHRRWPLAWREPGRTCTVRRSPFLSPEVFMPDSNSSPNYSWLAVFAFLERMPPTQLVTRDAFEAEGAADLWNWAAVQGCPFADAGTWQTYADLQSAKVVREMLPLWYGILAMHPTRASFVALLEASSALSAFADHGYREWRELVAEGAAAPPETHLALVPRSGDWLEFLFSVTQTWLAPHPGQVERVTEPPRTSASQGPRARTSARRPRRR